MERLKIKILTILLASTICSFGQFEQQGYQNGFVAATSNGIYYLMDGDNQWLNLTATPTYGVSFGGYNLWSNDNIASDILYFGNVFGYKLFQKRMSVGLNSLSFYKKSMTSKLKYKDFSFLIYKNDGNSSWMAINEDYLDPNHFIFGSTLYPSFNNFTSLATDNDSTIVVVGSDNVMRKKYFSKFDNSYDWDTIEGLNSGSSTDCHCPDGYTDTGTSCQLIETSSPTPPSNPQYLVNYNNNYYSTWGTAIFNSFNIDGTGSYTLIPSSNSWWKNIAGNNTDGPLNRCAVWTEYQESGQDIGFPITINIQQSKIYYVGFGCDNYGIVKVNGTTVIQQDITALNAMWSTSGDATGFRYWYVYPIQLNAGLNIIEVYGHNVEYNAAIGVEVYNATSAEIAAATSYTDLGNKLIFSTKDYVGQPVYLGTGGVGYTCPEGYQLSVVNNVATCVKTTNLPYSCTPTPSAHQITYNPNDDLFYIVSDEGYIYEYDKTIVTRIDTIPSAYLCDSITDLAYSKKDSILYIGIKDIDGDRRLIADYVNYKAFNAYGSFGNKDIVLSTDRFGNVAYNTDNNFYLRSETDLKVLPSISSEVTVYDLDYIDYLPFIDKNPPVITMIGVDTTIVVCGTYIDRGATAIDDIDGNITSKIVTVNNVNNKLPGIYHVTYDVTDNNGNHATQVVRTVTVLNNLETVTIDGKIWLKYNLSINDGGTGIVSPNDDPSNDCTFGLLYNYAAAVRIAALVPGYHLPTMMEMSDVMTYVGVNGGGTLKETGYTYWNSPNTGATNSTGFSARGAGAKYSGGFYGFKQIACWWVQYQSPNYVEYYLKYDNNYTYVGSITTSDQYNSVRLVKN